MIQTASSPNDSNTVTILNVDDNEAIRYTRSRILRNAGYRILEAGTGLEALNMLATFKPRLLVLDVNLPDMDGLEICRTIKSDPAMKHVMVLQMSAARGTAMDRAAGLNCGADAYLVEPVHPVELIAVVRALLRLVDREAENHRLIQQLAQSERRFAEATDAGDCGLWDWDIVGGNLEWFGAHERLAGMLAGSFSGKIDVFGEILHPDDRERVWRKLGEMMAQREERYADEYRFVHPDGSVRWMSGTGRFFYNDRGAVRMTGIVKDITERKQAEEALREGKERLARHNEALELAVSGASAHEVFKVIVHTAKEQAGDAARAALFMVDAEGARLRFCASAGLSEAYTRAVDGFHISPDKPSCGTAAYTGRAVMVRDVEHDPLWVPYLTLAREHGIRACCSFPILSFGGKALGTLAVYYRTPCLPDPRTIDTLSLLTRTAAVIIEWHREAEDRKRAEAALVESESRLRTLTTALPQLVWVCSSAGDCLFLGAQWERATGQSTADALGYGWAEMIHPDDRSRTVEAWRQMVEAGGSYQSEYRLRTREGTYRWYLARAEPVRDVTGSVLQWIGTSTDIHDAKQSEAALHESEERLRVFSEQLERLVEERTQELAQSQTHLRALAMELNLAEQRERKKLAVVLHDYLAQLLVLCRLKLGQARRPGLPQKAEEMVKETEEVLNQALNYTRSLMAELSPPILQEHGLPAGLRWLGEQMERHGLQVQVEVGDASCASLPDDCAVLLFQSVRELLMNALKHAKSNKVAVRLQYGERRLCIEVRDDGVGFDLTAAVGSAPNAMSSKFGLFSIRERMTGLGGWFDLQSAPGEGTTATLVLPLGAVSSELGVRSSELAGGSHQRSAVNSESVNSELRTHNPELHRQDTKQIRVLLVDDHVMVRRGLRAVLDSYPDIEVVGEAWNGETAVTAADMLHPAIVLMDINMPKMNGIDATARIILRHPEIIVIGLSVNAGGANDTAMKHAGAAMLLTKEMAMDGLYQAIQDALKKRRVRAQGTSAQILT